MVVNRVMIVERETDRNDEPHVMFLMHDSMRHEESTEYDLYQA